MNKKSVLILFAACGFTAQAQTQGGGISAQMLQEIQKEQKQCAKERVISNAVYGMSIDALAKNYRVAAKPIDTHFSVEPANRLSPTRSLLADAGCSAVSMCCVLTTPVMPTR